MHNDDTLTITYQSKDNGTDFEIIPESFLPYDFNKNFTLKVVARWKKEVAGDWLAVGQPEVLEAEFSTFLHDIAVGFYPSEMSGLVSVYATPIGNIQPKDGRAFGG